MMNLDRFYRYTLTRTFLTGEGRMVFVMLNPSTADRTQDDPTIRRCQGFAKREGCREMLVVNLFARRSTQPQELPYLCSEDGMDPDLGELGAWHRAFTEESRFVVAAWGTPGSGRLGRLIRNRLPVALAIAQTHGCVMQALGTTAGGWPRHPLYVRADAPLRPWACPEIT